MRARASETSPASPVDVAFSRARPHARLAVAFISAAPLHLLEVAWRRHDESNNSNGPGKICVRPTVFLLCIFHTLTHRHLFLLPSFRLDMTSMMYNDKARFASLERTPSGRPTPKLRRRVPQRTVYLFASVVLLFFFYLSHNTNRHTAGHQQPQDARVGSIAQSTHTGELPCRSLSGADDVVVILKTGSTELRDKLPVHLNTTLRCYPHYLIFSDYEETYKSEHIYDALEFVNWSIRHRHPDFELWRRLQKDGRAALKPYELSGPISKPQKDAMGKPSNLGWKLDKWKFLPMVNRTLHEYPDKKWYIFVETDTYVMWQTLLNYLHALDAEKPYYIGGQIWIADVQFAHGGTGFAVSHPAMKNVVDMYQAEQTAWEKFADDHWAGDCVLGKAFKDSGTNLTEAWPIWQGDDVGKMEFSRKDGPGEGYRLWCMPSVSYHHLGPTVVEELWRFEQDWMSRAAKVGVYLPPNCIVLSISIDAHEAFAAQRRIQRVRTSTHRQGKIGLVQPCRRRWRTRAFARGMCRYL